MRRTIPQQIATNLRQSLIYSVLMVALLTSLGTVIVGISAPRQWYLGTAGAFVLAVICGLIARFQGPGIMLAITGARKATHSEDQVLDNVAEEMAIAAGIPKPEIYVIDDPSPNAFATGMDPAHGIVVFTTGIIQKLDRDELQGVMAHEMSHIRNYDIRFMTTISLVAGLIPMLADLFRNMIWFGGGRSRDNDRDSDSAGIFAIVGIVLAIVAPVFAVLLQLAISRQREFLADAGAAELTRYPEGLARALQKLDADPYSMRRINTATQHMFIVNPIHDGGASLFSTHPSTQERIKALMGLMGAYPSRAAASIPLPAQEVIPTPIVAPPPVGGYPVTHTALPGYEDMPDIPDQSL